MCTYWRCAPPIMGRFHWQIISYIFHMLNLVICYHCMTLTVPSWCNLKLQVFNQYYSIFAQCLYAYWRCSPVIILPQTKTRRYKGITSICLSVHPDFVFRHISVDKNAYITGMFCSDACPDTILVLLMFNIHLHV